MSHNNLCIIPARGGSKRIPKKNVQLFLGKPIIAYSIEAALKSKCFTEVMVSTDDNDIAKIAVKYGATVPSLRSIKNSNDFATLQDVIEEVKSDYESKGEIFDNICCLFATAPLVTPDLLVKGYEFLINNRADSVRPIVKFSYPIQRAFRLSQSGEVEMINSEYLKTRSQDLEPAFYDSGMFYWMNFHKGLKGEKRYAFEVKESQAQDIDNEEDWILAELKFKMQNDI
ncbi:pseudaminic acid cytidylyltransferase [Dokdonia sp. R86516]|uniref:pseudaminic acid cytidylyltransferase n=1 Tax=Dokdonia sp. R86516 TaxID=3093856 RepID=UPI0037C6572D